MQRQVQRHRYPKKRNIPRILLLAALPVLLIALLIGASVLLAPSVPKDAPERTQGDPRFQKNAWDSIRNSAQDSARATRPDTLADLPPDVAYPAGSLPASLAFDRLVLEKSKRRLTAYAGKKPVRVYLVALGDNPYPTPEGSYSISGKHTDSAYHRSLDISYKSPGKEIAIHGLAPEYASVGRFHRLTDWTFGSMAVTNEEIEELFRHTPVGTPIDILP